MPKKVKKPSFIKKDDQTTDDKSDIDINYYVTRGYKLDGQKFLKYFGIEQQKTQIVT